jgi:YfiH family protein
MHQWQWQTWQGQPYLTCSLLSDWSHGFFTKQSWPAAPEQLVQALHPEAAVFRTRQVHGNTVLHPSELADLATSGQDGTTPPLADADGLVSEQAFESVWVCSADCVPVLIADVETRQVAAVHAGWRGTATSIIPRAIARLQAQGSQIQNLKVALGPAIAGAVYQVSQQVAAEVGRSILPELGQSVGADGTPSEDESILKAMSALPNSPLMDDPHPGRVRIDIREINRLQLQALGLTSEQVAIAPYCTYQELDHFFSYRRDRLKKVQWSGIVMGHD